MPIAILLFSSFFTILAWLRLDYALFFLIASLPAYLIRFSLFSLPSTLLEIMILITFAVWFIKEFWPNFKNSLKNQQKRKPYPFSWEIIALTILSFIAIFVAGFQNSALGAWKAYFFEPILVFILIINIYKNKKDWSKILWGFLLSAASIIILAIYQKITGQLIPNSFWAEEATRRVVSWFEYPNAVGLYLSPLILILVGWLFSLPKKVSIQNIIKKSLIIAIILGSIISVYFAKSEGALIGIAAGLLTFGLFSGGKKSRITIITSLLILITILSSTNIRNTVWEKISFQDLSGQIRLQQWKETINLLKEGHIISGNGLSNYQRAVLPYHQEGIFFNRDKIENFDALTWANLDLQKKYWQPVEIYLYPHNIFLNFWTEIGLFGALAFFWLFFKACFLAFKLSRNKNPENRKEKYLTLGLFSSLIVIMTHGLVDVPYFKNDLAVMFFIILSFIGLLNLHHQIKDKEI